MTRGDRVDARGGRRSADAPGRASSCSAGPGGRVQPVGSKGGKPRKELHKLPKVGSPENREYELHQKQKEAFGGWPILVVVVILVLGFAAWIALTAF
jgi:hypothetical protein